MSGREVVAMNAYDFDELLKRIRNGRIPCRGFNAYCPREIVIAGPGFSLIRAREFAERSRDRAAALGVHYVGIGSPLSRNLPDGFSVNLGWEQATSFFEMTAEIFDEAEITVCVEALGKSYCNFINTVDEANRIVCSAARPNLKLVVDFYNMEMEREANINLLPFVKNIAHAHISDDAGSPQKRWFLKPIKRKIHVERVKKLLACGYAGGITLEVDLPLKLEDAKQSFSILKSAVI